MAWFEGLSSSLKGQITNLAKNVLTDDTDSGQNDGEGDGNSSFLGLPRASNDQRPGTSGWDDDIVTDTFVNQSSPESRHNETQNVTEPQEEEETSIIPKKLASFLSLGKGSDAEEQIAALQEENRALRLENEAKNNEIRNYTRVIRELESTVAVGQDENSNLSTGMEELDIQHQQAIEQVLSVKEETHKQLEALQKAYADLEESHKTLTEEKEDGGRRESSQSEELGRIREENAKLLKEMEEIRKKADKNDVLIQELEEKDKELEELENANSALRDDIEMLKNEAENNRSSLPPILENDEEIESLNNKIVSLESENASLKEEIDKLKSENVPPVENPAPENDERVEALEHRISSLESEITILREVRHNLETENNNSCRKIERLTLSLQTAEGSIRNYDNLQLEAERLREIKDQDDLMIRQRNRYIRDVEYQLEMCREENEKLRQDLSEKDQNNEMTWYENRGKEELLNQENAALKKKITQMENQAKEVDQELEKLQKEIDVKQNKLCELTFEINSVSEELKTSQKKEADLKLQMKEMELKLDSSKDELEDTQEVKLAQFKEELVKLSEENAKIQKELFEKINEISSLKDSMNAERENFASERSNFEKVIENLNGVSNEFHIYKDIQKQKDSEFKRQLETKEDELNKLKSHIEEKEFAWNEQFTKAMADFEDKFNQQDELLQKIDLERNNEESNEVQELKKSLEQAKNDYDLLKTESEKREKLILDDFALKYQQHEKQIEQMMSEKDVQLTSAITNYNDLRAQYDSMVQKCSTLESNLNDVTNDNKELLKRIQIKEVVTTGLASEVEQVKLALRQEKENSAKLEKSIEEFRMEQSKAENELKEKESYLEQIDGAKSKEITVLKQEVESLKNQLEYATQLMHVAERQEAEGRGVTPPPPNQNESKESQEELNRITTALLKEQTENKLLANEVSELKDTNTKLNTQLSRLKSHLLELENYYTSMEVSSQEKIAELEAKQAKVDDWFKSSSTAYTSANIRANQQVESLTQQVRLLTEHKEKMGAELSRAEDEAQKQLAAVTNLQAVLHQFQRDKQRDIEFETDRIKQKLNQSYKANDELAKQIDDLREQLNETKKGLVAATRLTEQLDQKEELIKSLKIEVADLQKKLNLTEEKLKNINSTFEAKIDRNLIKNLLVGYVSSGPKYKEQALRVISQVLELSKEERQRVGLDMDGNLHSEQGSLSEAFIRFLETESQPKQQVFVPLSQPSSTNPSRKNSQSSAGSILLEEAQMSLPNFTGRNAGSILKDVLKDRNS